jgi:sulfate adenylyltransferase large subunit
MKTLKFATCGNVDSGKSTLIGRILFEAQALFSEQLEALKRASVKQGKNDLNLALVTDGLSEEQAKGITIDVAYRYFKSPTRRFVLVDTPGHEEFTPNTITGISNVDLVLLLVDAGEGIRPQTLRHASLASLLKAPKILVCVNKMDLINFDQNKFNRLCQDFRDQVKFIHPVDVDFIPISAFFNENIKTKSEKLPWYKGDSLFKYLNDYNLDNLNLSTDLRIPIQTCIHHDGKTYFGAKLISGEIEVGQAVFLGKDKAQYKVNRLYVGDKSVMRAGFGSSITFTLDQDVKVKKGDLLYSGKSPIFSSGYDAYLYWMNEQPLDLSKEYIILKNAKQVRVKLQLSHKKSNAYLSQDTDSLKFNQIAYVSFKGEQQLDFDPYDQNKGNGKFIIIDPETNKTVGAGIIDHTQEQSA